MVVAELWRTHRDNAHHDRVRTALFENIDAKTRIARHTKREVCRTCLFNTIERRLLIADDQFCNSRCMGGRQLLQPRDSNRDQFPGQLNLRRSSRTEDQVANLVGRAQHLPQNSDEVWWRWSRRLTGYGWLLATHFLDQELFALPARQKNWREEQTSFVLRTSKSSLDEKRRSVNFRTTSPNLRERRWKHGNVQRSCYLLCTT